MTNTLQQLRMSINEIDQNILKLITQRSNLLSDILEAKQSTDNSAKAQNIFDPEREHLVLDSIASQNKSCLSDSDIKSIFQSIMSACRNLQIDRAKTKEIFKISIQGTKGSYSEMAAKKYCQLKSIPNLEIDYAISSENVLKQVTEGVSDYGIVALNNAQGGLVEETINALTTHQYLILDSVVLLVKHSLLIKPGTENEKIKYIYSHPQALKQCRDYCSKTYPNAELRAYADTALAALDLANSKLPQGSAVIANKHCVNAYELLSIDDDIQDLGQQNETLFLLIKSKKVEVKDGK